MGRVQSGRLIWFNCIVAGLTLMNLALFLHPMSPGDFLELVCADPLRTVLDANGGGIAVFFWLSALTLLTGLLGVLVRSQHFQRAALLHKHHHKARTI